MRLCHATTGTITASANNQFQIAARKNANNKNTINTAIAINIDIANLLLWLGEWREL